MFQIDLKTLIVQPFAPEKVPLSQEIKQISIFQVSLKLFNGTILNFYFNLSNSI